MNVFKGIYFVSTHVTIFHSASVSKTTDCSAKQPTMDIPLEPQEQSTNPYCTTSQTPETFVITAVII